MRIVQIVASFVVVLSLLQTVSGQPVDLHTVRLSIQSPRLLGMSMDDDGSIWLGSTHRVVYRYVPPDSCTLVERCVGGPGQVAAGRRGA